MPYEALVGDTWWIPKRSIRNVAEEWKERKHGRYLFKAAAKWCRTCLNLNILGEEREEGMKSPGNLENTEKDLEEMRTKIAELNLENEKIKKAENVADI